MRSEDSRFESLSVGVLPVVQHALWYSQLNTSFAFSKFVQYIYIYICKQKQSCERNQTIRNTKKHMERQLWQVTKCISDTIILFPCQSTLAFPLHGQTGSCSTQFERGCVRYSKNTMVTKQEWIKFVHRSIISPFALTQQWFAIQRILLFVKAKSCKSSFTRWLLPDVHAHAFLLRSQWFWKDKLHSLRKKTFWVFAFSAHSHCAVKRKSDYTESVPVRRNMRLCLVCWARHETRANICCAHLQTWVNI